MAKPMMTVREMPEFLTAAKGLISDAEREMIVEMLARAPECGDIIPTIYAKNAKDNLTAAQRKALAAVVSAIKAEIDQ